MFVLRGGLISLTLTTMVVLLTIVVVSSPVYVDGTIQENIDKFS